MVQRNKKSLIFFWKFLSEKRVLCILKIRCYIGSNPVICFLQANEIKTQKQWVYKFIRAKISFSIISDNNKLGSVERETVTAN